MIANQFHAVNLVYSKKHVPETTRVNDVVDHFRKNSGSFLAVAGNGKISGIVGREKVLAAVGKQFGWSLYASKPIALLMNTAPLVFDGKGDTVDLLRSAVRRPVETVYEDVIITMNGVFAGLVSVRHLMLYELDNLDRQCVVLLQQRSLLQKTIAAYLLDRNVSAEAWTKKVEAVSAAAERIEALEEQGTQDISRPSASAGMRGSLDACSVIDLVQLLVQGAKTGRLELYPDGKEERAPTFEVFVHQGKIVHAEDGGDGGHYALWKALKVCTGEFTFFCGDPGGKTTIHENPMTLLIEACRQQDEEAMGMRGNLAEAVGGDAPFSP